MLKNIFFVALRNFTRNRVFSVINTVGLAVGLACFWIIVQYVTFERSYDDFHENGDRIYRVRLDQYKHGEVIFRSSENYPGVGPALQKDFPEVLSNARLYNMGSKNNVVITYEQAPGGPIGFKHRRFLYADSAFLPMFSYRLVLGDPYRALAEPFSIVISESYAKNYFGNENPLGKFLRLRDDDFNNELCKVTGVVEDPHPNSHLKFDALISYSTLYTRWATARNRYDANWSRKDMYTFILLKEGTDVREFEEKLGGFMKKHNPELEKQFRRDELVLQPLQDIHLYSRLTDEPEPNGNGDSVYFLTLIAIFIVLIAWINYINLATARSMDRAKEVGVRKVMGAEKRGLMLQFIAEAFVTNLIAMILSFLLVAWIWPWFRDLTGTPTGFVVWKTPMFIALALGIFVTGSVLSGLYPAMVLSAFEPVKVLKGKFHASARGVWLRKALVIFQFTASAALIVGTLVVYRQITFMREYDLGLNIDQTIVVERPGMIVDRQTRPQLFETFKTELRKNPQVRDVAGSGTVPGKKLRMKVDVRPYSGSKDQAVPLALSGMDVDFLNTLGMKLVAGRNFSKAFPQDPDTSVMLTESAARLMGYKKPDDAVGKTLAIDDFRFNPIVVGVIADYHHESPQEETLPTLIFCDRGNVEYFMIKTSTENIAGTIGYVKDAWDRVFPGNPFEYFFLDEYFARQYRSDQTFGRVFGLFAMLAMLVGCLGLFGLSSFVVSRRTKEIAIRKVCGAPIGRLLVHLAKDFMILIGAACLIAWPLMHVLMSRWLERFAYRTSIGWEVFVISGLVMFVTAWLTIGYQTVKAALRNPVVYLRYE